MCTRIVIVLVLAFVSGTLARNLLKELQSDNTHPCKAENLKFAATYICDKNGKIHCQTGWKEPTRNQTLEYIDQYNPCSEPICDPVCQYGRCIEPNICACEVGWFGNTCSECIPLAGCIHGGCQQAFECNCDLGKDKKTNGKYTGTHCDIPKCNNCIHGTCTEPDICTCDYGWKGKTCNECIALPGCAHGSCKGSPNTCQCDKGWKGHLCDEPICAQGCNLTNGYCIQPGGCHCNTGWKGKKCNECIPHWDCPETSPDACINPSECLCEMKHHDNHVCDVVKATFNEIVSKNVMIQIQCNAYKTCGKDCKNYCDGLTENHIPIAYPKIHIKECPKENSTYQQPHKKDEKRAYSFVSAYECDANELEGDVNVCLYCAVIDDAGDTFSDIRRVAEFEVLYHCDEGKLDLQDFECKSITV